MFNKKRAPEDKFIESIQSTQSLRALIERTHCPACKQQTLKLAKYVTSTKEWGADVTCTNCNFGGEVNSTGFTFSRVDSKGKAKE